jgi:hypothetical protein
MNELDPVGNGTSSASLRHPGDVRSADALMPHRTGDHGHAVSWPAIFAGAAASAALSLILLVLGVGLGLSSVSPWAAKGASSSTLGAGAIVWILFVAIVASGTGGYLAGRLRTKWTAVHSDEVYFRDTAHGFLAWAVATLVTAASLTTAIGSVVGTGVETAGATAGGAGAAVALAAGRGPLASGQAGDSERGIQAMPRLAYYTDSLFRATPSAGAAASAPSAVTAVPAGTPAQVNRIFVRSFENQGMATGDTQYLGQLVAQRTGMPQADAEKLVNTTYSNASTAAQEAQAKAKDAADKTRKAAAYAALWLFVSLLLGAFSASLLATLGGRQREL